MLWIKAFHIVFVVSWFSGLFYLPRIFVNLALVQEESALERSRLLLMAGKLFKFTTLLSLPALIFGLVLWLYYRVGEGSSWLDVKLFFVLLVCFYHYVCGLLLKRFRENRSNKTHLWFRWFNELPVVFLIIICVLVVVKPI